MWSKLTSPCILSLLLLGVLNLASSVVRAQESSLLHDVMVEIFLEGDDDNSGSPCSSPENYTLVFKEMKLDSSCVTHMFPIEARSEDDEERWLQFSARANLVADGGLQFRLYFTRDELTGAVTHCAKENIAGLPYPLDVSPDQSGACRVIPLPKYGLRADDDSEDDDEEDDGTIAVRITYDVPKAQQVIQRLAAHQWGQVTDTEESSGYIGSTSKVVICLFLVVFLNFGL